MNAERGNAAKREREGPTEEAGKGRSPGARLGAGALHGAEAGPDAGGGGATDLRAGGRDGLPAFDRTYAVRRLTAAR